MADIAYPVRGNPDEDADYDEYVRRFLRTLGEAPKDSVIAYEPNDEDAAHLDELWTTALEPPDVAARSLTVAVSISHIS